MEKKIYRNRIAMMPTLFGGILLTYISIDNIIEGPLRIFLKEHIDLKEFGSNIREEGLYYLILGIGLFQIIIALQSFVQPVIEINNGRISLRTKEKSLSVVRDIYEIKNIEKKGENNILFIFEDTTFNVLTEYIKDEELTEVINFISESKEI
jgi:hypothetical protein|tara:strand:- start:726 stop:1181 length:456 start_codon:yes stop_codon:yes gene_type:complete